MLKLSTKSRYATRILTYIALKSGAEPISAQEISKAEAISADYVEQILSKLKTTGLVISHRGLNGGFSLGRDASSISVSDIITATEGVIAIAPCRKNNCNRATECATTTVWQDASEMLTGFFTKTSIRDLAIKANRIARAQSLSFEI